MAAAVAAVPAHALGQSGVAIGSAASAAAAPVRTASTNDRRLPVPAESAEVAKPARPLMLLAGLGMIVLIARRRMRGSVSD